MTYCKYCGNEVNQNQDFCPNCGANVKTGNVSNTNTNTNYVNDSGDFGWGLLGFCVPIVGLILFLVWRDEKPLTAKAAGTGALISFITSVIFAVIYFFIIIAAVSSM